MLPYHATSANRWCSTAILPSGSTSASAASKSRRTPGAIATTRLRHASAVQSSGKVSAKLSQPPSRHPFEEHRWKPLPVPRVLRRRPAEIHHRSPAHAPILAFGSLLPRVPTGSIFMPLIFLRRTWG